MTHRHQAVPAQMVLQFDACKLPGVLVTTMLGIHIEKGLLCSDHVV